jgi:methyl-accepting chemotaxis protein
MNLKDLKIGTQLLLGLGLIQALVLALGVVAWMQSDKLWLLTQGLYDHPLIVTRAVGEIQAQILAMHRNVKDICLVENGRESVIQDLDVREAAVQRQFSILYDRYLGPRKDIEELEKAFAQWKAIRAEIIRLVREGKIADAIKRTLPEGAGGGHVDKILGAVRDVSRFAEMRGDQFYRDAAEEKRVLNRQLTVVVVLILLMSVMVGWLLLKGIKAPIAELTMATEQFRHGRLDIRSRHASANEYGKLSASFNTMAEAIQTQMQINEMPPGLLASCCAKMQCMRSAGNCSKNCSSIPARRREPCIS